MTLCGDKEHDSKQVLAHMKSQNVTGETDFRTLTRVVWTIGNFYVAKEGNQSRDIIL
jgi:hypothetical protein